MAANPINGRRIQGPRQHRTDALFCLYMAKKPGKKNKSAALSKKKKQTKRQGSSKQSSGGSASASAAPESSSARASVILPSSKSHAPPWQVLSAKDAKNNVEKEKKRRERIKMGLSDTHHSDLDDDDISTKRKSKALLSDASQQLLKWKRFNPSTVPCGISFIGSYLDKRLPPRLGVPEVAFLGRSNVGKSSLLNRLSSSALGSGNQFASDQARVGKTPGATASVNLYAMLGQTKAKADLARPILGLVDLPGFGYARLSKEVKDSVQLAAERYLGKRQELALGILLVDARREPSDDDRAVLAALFDMGVPLVVVATKMDKLSKQEAEPRLEVIRLGLGLPEGQPFSVSSVTGEGTKDLWKIILEACEARIEELRDELERADNKEAEEAETIQLDDEGNPLLFADDEDVAYDQGYDWVHDTAVLYERDADDDLEYDEEGMDSFLDDEYEQDDFLAESESMKLKDLKKRARDMQRRGEL